MRELCCLFQWRLIRKGKTYLGAISNYCEDLWIEFEISSITQSRQKNLINISYNPNKSNTNRFLEDIALEIGHAVTKNKSVMLMGDFYIYYLHPLEKAKLDTMLTPYDLIVSNNRDATKTTNNSQFI